MVQLKTYDDICRIRESGLILIDTLKEIKKIIEPDLKTIEIDRFAYNYIINRGAKPSFLGYMDYPSTLCISVNNEVIHGIPGKRQLKLGDIVGIDLGINLKGFYSDAAYTFKVGRVTEAREQLVRVTRECLERAVLKVKAGKRIHDISKAVYNHARSYGYELVRQYCGHGVGFSQHEDPQIPNYVSNGPNPRLKNGMVLAIEPMVTAGTWEIKVLDNGWTVITRDGKDSAHFEYTVAVLNDKAEILTPLDI
jgi:methionyl aminopeptidase